MEYEAHGVNRANIKQPRDNVTDLPRVFSDHQSIKAVIQEFQPPAIIDGQVVRGEIVDGYFQFTRVGTYQTQAAIDQVVIFQPFERSEAQCLCNLVQQCNTYVTRTDECFNLPAHEFSDFIARFQLIDSQ